MVQSPQHEDFIPHVNKSFSFDGRPEVLRLASVDVIDSPNRPEHLPKPFTLVFHGPRGDVMPEGLYPVRVEDGARFELYVIPIHTPAPDRQDYQAVFN
jgi:hypothetical protein